MGLVVLVGPVVEAELLLRFVTGRTELMCGHCDGCRIGRAIPSASRELTELTREAAAEVYGRTGSGARRGDRGTATSCTDGVRLQSCEPGALAVGIIVVTLDVRRIDAVITVADRIKGTLLES